MVVRLSEVGDSIEFAHPGHELQVYESVRLTIQGRYGPFDVVEVPDDLPVSIGQLPLEYFDLVIDPRSRRLIGNPAHGGEHVLELI